MPEPKPAPSQSEDDEADEPDTVAEEIDEAVEEMEEAESEDVGKYFEGEEEVNLDLAETDIGEEVGSETASEPASEPGPFDGVPDSSKSFDAEEPTEPTEAAAQVQDTVPSNINAGAARLSVLGLPDEFEHYGETQTKDELREEFEEVFETFKLGAYGEEVAEEYLLMDVDEVDPLTGFTVSLIACSTIVLMSRPDSDEILSKVKRRAQP